MDNYPDLGLYSDLAFSDTSANDPQTNDLTNVFQQDAKIGPQPSGTGQDSALGTVLALPALLYDLVGDVGSILKEVESAHPLAVFKALKPAIGLVGNIFSDMGMMTDTYAHGGAGGAIGVTGETSKTLWQFIADWTGGALYRGMLEVGLNVDTSQFDDDANRGVDTIDTMLTFAFILQVIGGVVEHTGKALFAGRWGTAISKALMELPEELGLTWAMGMSIDEAFKVAVGRSIEEGINRQKRGNRIEWQQLRAMLKQHAFEGLATNGRGKITGSISGVPDTPGLDVFKDLLKNQGFPDWQIDLLAKLNDVQIPVADIAQLWYRDIIKSDRAKELIGELGFSPEQTAWLFELYIDKAENTASVTYRSIARQMFVNHLITQDMYTGILEHAHYPAKLIADDLAAIALEQDVGKVLQSVSVIKAQYQRGTHDADVARKQLRELNYHDTYITELLTTWDLPPLHRSHGLTQSKILSYWYSHVITDRNKALTQLMAAGLTTDAANFLLDHPTAAHATQHALTPGLITQAYVDGAIAQSDLAAAFKSTGVTDDALPKYEAVAHYRLAHRKGSPIPTQSPDTALYREAQKEGLIDFQTAVQRYEQLGWDGDSSLLIAEIVNKGPYQKPGPPPFASLEDAMLYMVENGYNIINPPDPMLIAAEEMLSAAGYSYTKMLGT